MNGPVVSHVEGHSHMAVSRCPDCGVAVFYCYTFEDYFHTDNAALACFLVRETHADAMVNPKRLANRR